MFFILMVLSCPKVSEKGYSQNFGFLRLKHTKRNKESNREKKMTTFCSSKVLMFRSPMKYTRQLFGFISFASGSVSSALVTQVHRRHTPNSIV